MLYSNKHQPFVVKFCGFCFVFFFYRKLKATNTFIFVIIHSFICLVTIKFSYSYLSRESIINLTKIKSWGVLP